MTVSLDKFGFFPIIIYQGNLYMKLEIPAHVSHSVIPLMLFQWPLSNKYSYIHSIPYSILKTEVTNLKLEK